MDVFFSWTSPTSPKEPSEANRTEQDQLLLTDSSNEANSVTLFFLWALCSSEIQSDVYSCPISCSVEHDFLLISSFMTADDENLLLTVWPSRFWTWSLEDINLRTLDNKNLSKEQKRVKSYYSTFALNCIKPLHINGWFWTLRVFSAVTTTVLGHFEMENKR